MFEELDQLMKVTKILEAANSVEPEEEEETEKDTKGTKKHKETDDVGAFYYDDGGPSAPYESDAPDGKWTEIKGDDEDDESDSKSETEPDDDGENVAVAGSASDLNPDDKPILEQDRDTDELENALDEGLGLHGSLHKALHAMEAIGGVIPSKFNIGDLIHMVGDEDAGIKTPSVIFIVKNCDGDMVTAAKPTAKISERAIGHNGAWPEFYFQQDEVEPMTDKLSDVKMLNNIIGFNDASVIDECSLTGNRIVDTDTCKRNQKIAVGNQFDKRADEVWENMFGQSLSDSINGTKPQREQAAANLKDILNGKVGGEVSDTTNGAKMKMSYNSLNEGVEKVLHGTIFDY